MLESKFKKETIERIKKRFRDLDLDFIDTHNRSMPDIFVIGPWSWAALEFKRSKLAAQQAQQPNQIREFADQEYHIIRLNRKGYAAFVFPENLEEVLDDLEGVFSS